MSHNSPAIVYTDHPKNTEPTLDALVARENFYTPLDLAFQRNHAEFPDETAFAAFWKLSVVVEEGVVAKRWEIPRDRLGEARKGPGTEEGSVERVLWEGGWDDMRTAVGQGGGDRRLRAALQCAGNRRNELSRVRQTEGIQWASGTIANILWQGLPLKAFLTALGVPSDEKVSGMWAHFESEVSKCEDDSYYGASIPLEDIMSPKAAPFLLAHSANGAPLPHKNGAPCRLITPGTIGARSVKWIQRIILRPNPSHNYYFELDYKQLPPDVTDPSPEEKDALMRKTPAMFDFPMSLMLAEGKVERGDGQKKAIRIRGWSVGSEGVPIASVQLRFIPFHSPPASPDFVPDPALNAVRALAAEESGDSSWTEAALEAGDPRESEGGDGEMGAEWGWVLWEGVVDVSEEVHAQGGWIVGRCVDKQGKVQEREGAWNVRGVGMAGWGVREVRF